MVKKSNQIKDNFINVTFDLMLIVSIKPWDIKAPIVKEKSHAKLENLNVWLYIKLFHIPFQDHRHN